MHAHNRIWIDWEFVGNGNLLKCKKINKTIDILVISETKCLHARNKQKFGTLKIIKWFNYKPGTTPRKDQLTLDVFRRENSTLHHFRRWKNNIVVRWNITNPFCLLLNIHPYHYLQCPTRSWLMNYFQIQTWLCVLYSLTVSQYKSWRYKYGYCLFTSCLIKIKEGVSVEMCILAILQEEQ